MPGRRYGRRSYGESTTGREQAQRHIEAARKLSIALGGTDKIVKKFLFDLSGAKLQALLDEYGAHYGDVRKSYAIETLPDWRSGRVQMSGLVATRFYALLPPRMPLRLKYDIAERLWRHVGPSSQRAIRFGPDASKAQLLKNIESHISSVVSEYTIPTNLAGTFDWLASDDVNFKQQLLNHLRMQDRELVSIAAKAQIDIMFQHVFGENSESMQSFTHTLTVGKHDLMLIPDEDTIGFRFEQYTPFAQTGGKIGDDRGLWIFWGAVAVAIVIWIVIANT